MFENLQWTRSKSFSSSAKLIVDRPLSDPHLRAIFFVKVTQNNESIFTFQKGFEFSCPTFQHLSLISCLQQSDRQHLTTNDTFQYVNKQCIIIYKPFKSLKYPAVYIRASKRLNSAGLSDISDRIMIVNQRSPAHPPS